MTTNPRARLRNVRRRLPAVAPAALALVGVGVATAAQPDEDPLRRQRPGGSNTVIPAPHPVITEVLYRVPPDPVGDANQDGRRVATGDEFVEIFNPHDQPISLEGYTITDSQADTEHGVSFTFPRFTLPPRGVAVVFNGYRADFAGPWGDAAQPPGGPNPLFLNAYAFTMGMTSRSQAFADDGDFVLLSAPDGRPIDAVMWGSPQDQPPNNTIRLSRYLPAGNSSAQRIGATGDLVNHFMINNLFYSPGKVCVTAQGCDPVDQSR